MEEQSQHFLQHADKTRAATYGKCYYAQTKLAVAVAKEHERCVALMHGVYTPEFHSALCGTSVLAARLAAVYDCFTRRGLQGLPAAAKQEAAAAIQLSGDRYKRSMDVQARLDQTGQAPAAAAQQSTRQPAIRPTGAPAQKRGR